MNNKDCLYKIINFFQNNKDKKKLEETVIENLEFLDKLIEAIPNAIFYKDSNLIYKHCNNAFLQFLGKKRDEVIGHTAFDISPVELAQIYDKADKDLIKSKEFQTYQSKVKNVNGSYHDVIFNKAVVFNKDGEIIGIVGVIIDITERVKAEEKIKYLSRHDTLTDLYNRGYFEELFEKCLNKRLGNNKDFFLVILDLNELKSINDTYGHLAGDECISNFARNLKQIITATGIAARIGGDEFALISNDKNFQQLVKNLEALQVYLKNNYLSYEENKIIYSFSYGIASYPKDGKDYNSLMKLADIRMYEYKKRSREEDNL